MVRDAHEKHTTSAMGAVRAMTLAVIAREQSGIQTLDGLARRRAMNNAELDRSFQQGATKIVSTKITDGPGPLPHGIFEQAPRVIATLDDGSRVELFSFYAHERSFNAAEFVGLSVEQGRRLKFAPGHPPRCDGGARTW